MKNGNGKSGDHNITHRVKLPSSFGVHKAQVKQQEKTAQFFQKKPQLDAQSNVPKDLGGLQIQTALLVMSMAKRS